MIRADAARLAYGSVLLVAPNAVLRACGTEVTPAKERVARLVGSRHLVQVLVSLGASAPGLRRAGAMVDALHASTDIAAAVAWRSWRVVAGVDAGIALLLAVANVRAASGRLRLAHDGRER